MRIAQIAPVACRVPPKKYGGTERVVHALTEGLVKRGHKVTLFASGDSITTARLVSVVPKSLASINYKNKYGLNPHTLHNIGTAYNMQDEFDIIHDHHWVISLPTAHISKKPVVMPMHNPFTQENISLYKTFNKPYLVTLSNAQMPKGLKLPNYIGTVYNGLDMSHYPFSEKNDGYLLYVGRISEEKGTYKAIQVAQKLDIPLIIAAKIDLDSERKYFHKYISPNLSDKIRFIGQVDEKKRNSLMSRALAFLHPVKFHEPFGLTLIEAMTCGCPVVAFGKGSIPEVVKSGTSGYVVKNVSGMVGAIQKIDKVSRSETRKYSLRNFSAERMVTEYEKKYELVLRLQKIKDPKKYAYTISRTSPPQVKS